MKTQTGSRFAVLLAGLLALATTLATGPARADDDERAAQVTAATERATHWLDALDGGAHDQSWADVAAVMKEGRNLEEWINDVAGPRATLGKPIMRELQRADLTASVRGAPTGKYVTARFLSQFPKTPPLLETVLLTYEDGRWRVAGYNVAAAPDAVPEPSPPADKAGKEGPAAKPGG